MNKSLIVIVILCVFALSIFQTIYVFTETSREVKRVESRIDGQLTTGSLSLCINSPPVFELIDCPNNINQSTSIEDNMVECNISLYHPFGNLIDTSTLFYYAPGFNVTSFEDSLFIWANQSGVGNHSMNLSVRDFGDCPLFSSLEYNVTVHDINDPPHLTKIIASIRMVPDSSMSAFFLNDYFDDVDIVEEWCCPLNYSVFGNEFFQVNISQETSEVIIFNPANNCKDDFVYFQAKDPGNLTGDSNVVRLESMCVPEIPPDQVTPPAPMGPLCTPEWACDEWSQCYINETQFRTCTDLHRCNPFDYRRTFWRECEYSATCFDGVNNCHLMPDGSILCEEGVDCGGPCDPCKDSDPELETATCFDGVKNCHLMPDGSILCEEGVDCGGPCEACRRIETPGLIIEDESNRFIVVTIIVLLVLAALFMAYVVFRKEIKGVLAKIGWWWTRKKRKQVLLEDADKKYLLDLVNVTFTKINDSKNDSFNSSDVLVNDFLDYSRLYMGKALKIPVEFSKDDLDKSIELIVYNKAFGNALRLFADRQFLLEKKRFSISKQRLLVLIRELRMLIIISGSYDRKDFNFVSDELLTKGDALQRVYALLYNSFLALEFTGLKQVKKNYFQLLKLYDYLDESQKNMVYQDINKIYLYTKYLLSWL